MSGTPSSAGEALAPCPEEALVTTAAVKHALIIEDDLLVSIEIEERLARLGFNSFEKVWTEDDAVAAALRRRPDLVMVGGTIAAGSAMRAARRIVDRLDVPAMVATSAWRSAPQAAWRALSPRRRRVCDRLPVLPAVG